MSTPSGNGKSPQEYLQELVQKNAARMEALIRSGVAIEPASLVHARIESLIDSVAQAIGPAGPLWAVTARTSFELHMAEEFGRIEAEASRIQLAQGGAWTPSMIAQLARESGMFQVKRA